MTTAVGGGLVLLDNGAAVSERGLCWNTIGTPTTSDTCMVIGSGTGSFSDTITSLIPATTYYVRAFATNSAGTSYGNQINFTTSNTITATVSTTAISDITPVSTTGGGDVSDDGGEAVTDRGICWSASENPTLSDNCDSSGSGNGIFTTSLTDLEPGVMYYVRAYATNSNGTSYGDQEIFTTLTTTPVVTTAVVTSITKNTATSGGNVTKDGGTHVTSCGVCWSETENPTIADSCTNDSSGTGSFISYLTGLNKDTTYYVRSYATNANGTSYGEQKSFSSDKSTVLFMIVPVLSGLEKVQ